MTDAVTLTDNKSIYLRNCTENLDASPKLAAMAKIIVDSRSNQNQKLTAQRSREAVAETLVTVFKRDAAASQKREFTQILPPD